MRQNDVAQHSVSTTPVASDSMELKLFAGLRASVKKSGNRRKIERGPVAGLSKSLGQGRCSDVVGNCFGRIVYLLSFTAAFIAVFQGFNGQICASVNNLTRQASKSGGFTENDP